MDAPQLLDKERERTTFPPEELQQLVSGNPEMRHRMQAIAEADPLLGDKTSVSVHAYIDHSIVGAPYHTSAPSDP